MAKREDQAFLDWVMTQPSCLDRGYSQYNEDGTKQNVACHVRRANNAGTGFKPLWSAVPMTDAQHKIQSQQGELAVIMAYVKDWQNVLLKYQGENFVIRAKSFFDDQAAQHLAKWRKHAKVS